MRAVPKSKSRFVWGTVAATICAVTSALVLRNVGLLGLSAANAQQANVLRAQHPAIALTAGATLSGKITHLTYDLMDDTGKVLQVKEEWSALIPPPAALHLRPLADNSNTLLFIGKYHGILKQPTGTLLEEIWSADTSQSNVNYEVARHRAVITHMHPSPGSMGIAFPSSRWTMPVPNNPVMEDILHTEGGVQMLADSTVDGLPVSVLRIGATGELYYISKTTQQLLKYEWRNPDGHLMIQTLRSYEVLSPGQVSASIFSPSLPADVTVTNQ